MIFIQHLLLHQLTPLLPVIKVGSWAPAAKEQAAAVCHLLLLLLDRCSMPDK
jgi:hypothetical protein